MGDYFWVNFKFEKEPICLKRIAVDMDEVLADYSGELLKRVNKKYNLTITKKDLEGAHIHELYPEVADDIYGIVNTDSFFRSLPVIKDSQAVLEELSEHYEIVIATAAMLSPNSFVAKYDWLQKHFPFLNPNLYVFCGDKSTVKADYLIDDHIYQLNTFQDRGIMFTSPHNVNEPYDLRMDNWQELRTFFLKKANVKI